MSNIPALYVKGPVIAPGWIGRPEIGQTDRPLTAPEIQKMIYNIPLGYPIIDVEHDFLQQGSTVEQYITPDKTEFNGDVYDVGTLFVTSKITDPVIQKKVITGELTAYSLTAFPNSFKPQLKAILKSQNLFEQVKEGDWFGYGYSLVKTPFYPKARFKVFGDNEYIKKSFNSNLEVDDMGDEDKTAMSILEKMLDVFVIKKGSDDDKKYETELEKKVRELKENQVKLKDENEKLTKKVGKLQDKLDNKKDDDKKDDDDKDDKKDKDKKDKNKDKKDDKDKKDKNDDKDKKDDKKDDDDKDDSNDDDTDLSDVAITKSISIDDSKPGKDHPKSFLERCGCDEMGRNPKYLK